MSLKLHKHGLIKRRDWFRVLGELDAAGMSNARVADLLGVAKNTVYGWKMGADPTHALGETLLALHASRCGARKGQGVVDKIAGPVGDKGADKGAEKSVDKGADASTDANPNAARLGPAIRVSGGASTGPRAVLRRAGRRGGMH